MINFLNSEQKIIYAEKRVNNYLNDAKQKIILCRMLDIVYAENNEQFFWQNSEQFYLLQKIDFMNAVSIFKYTINMMCRVQILLMSKQILSMQKSRFDYYGIKKEKAFRYGVYIFFF